MYAMQNNVSEILTSDTGLNIDSKFLNMDPKQIMSVPINTPGRSRNTPQPAPCTLSPSSRNLRANARSSAIEPVQLWMWPELQTYLSWRFIDSHLGSLQNSYINVCVVRNLRWRFKRESVRELVTKQRVLHRKRTRRILWIFLF